MEIHFQIYFSLVWSLRSAYNDNLQLSTPKYWTELKEKGFCVTDIRSLIRLVTHVDKVAQDCDGCSSELELDKQISQLGAVHFPELAGADHPPKRAALEKHTLTEFCKTRPKLQTNK